MEIQVNVNNITRRKQIMGNRRLGAKRLNAVAKRGEQGLDLTQQAGAGIKPAVVSHRVIKRIQR